MVEIADADLPVFPFRVNWSGGVSERLEWATNVHAGVTGNEQRQGFRLTPRRAFEATITLWAEERQFLDLWLHRLVGTECMVPIWHDSVRTAQGAAQGDSEVWVDTRGLEFKIGSYGLLRGVSALSTERVEIAEVHDDRIVLAEPLAKDWPQGTRVEPLARGRIGETTKPTLHGDRAWQLQAQFELTREQPFEEDVADLDVYLGLPVYHRPPNRSANLDAEFEWAFNETDSGSGRRYRNTDNARATVRQKHEWLLRGRTAKAAFRAFLYYMRGRQRAVWLPTFMNDMTLSRNVGVGTNSLYVKACGLAYTGGGATSGRSHVCVQMKNGTRFYRRVTAMAAVGNDTEERLVLDSGFPLGVQMAAVERISWMDTARFENDRVEFKHVNAADGASTVSAVWQTFRNERTPPVILHAPIPAAAKTDQRCGPNIPETDPCGPCIPCAVTVFSWELNFNGCKEFYCPTRNWYVPDITSHPEGFKKRPSLPHLQEGETYADYANPSRGWPGVGISPIGWAGGCDGAPEQIAYESNAYNDPGSPWYKHPAAIELQGQIIARSQGSNGDFTITYPTAIVDGSGALQIQYGAFWCGDNIARGKLTRTICSGCGCGCSPAVLIEADLVGNVPYTWYW